MSPTVAEFRGKYRKFDAGFEKELRPLVRIPQLGFVERSKVGVAKIGSVRFLMPNARGVVVGACQKPLQIPLVSVSGHAVWTPSDEDSKFHVVVPIRKGACIWKKQLLKKQKENVANSPTEAFPRWLVCSSCKRQRAA